MDRLQLPSLPPSVWTLTNEESRSLSVRIPQSDYDPRKYCITCHGSGVFLWKGLGDEVREFDCNCRDQYVLFRWLMNSGVMLKYARLGWADFIYATESAMDAAFDYLDHRDRYVATGMGMTISGTRGNGKSLLAMLLVKGLIEKGVQCYATTFQDMIESFAEGWQSRESSQWFNAKVRHAPVLYIDDLGRERNRNKPESLGETMLEAVIRSRVASSLPTLMTTNLSQEDIEKGYGGHVMSLLQECSMPVEISGPDRREQIRERFRDEAVRGLTRPIVLE